MPWSIELIKQYEYKWYWSKLSGNEALPWSIELIEQYQIYRWDWSELSGNEALPWSIELLERFYGWHWWRLSMNDALPWSIELIERFKGEWDWIRLNSKAVACLPKLSLQDIDEVMCCQFSSRSLKPSDEECRNNGDVYCDDSDEYDDDQGAYYGDDGYLGDGMWSDSSKNDWNR